MINRAKLSKFYLIEGNKVSVTCRHNSYGYCVILKTSTKELEIEVAVPFDTKVEMIRNYRNFSKQDAKEFWEDHQVPTEKLMERVEAREATAQDLIDLQDVQVIYN